MEYLATLLVAIGFLQVLTGASMENNYEPMVAFICDRPAMHRGVNRWIPDSTTDCLDGMEDILAYCQMMYPDHNISNVVESSYMVTIPDWPMNTASRTHPHRVRPFRCLVGGFQSDALLVPQHCEFDHRHDQSLCEGFAHWNVVADEACMKKGHHLESFGMLLNCQLGKFSGVEYVCCPNEVEAQFHSSQKDDRPDSWEDSSLEEDEEENSEGAPEESKELQSVSSSRSSSEQVSSSSSPGLDENTMDYYEAYLRQKSFPSRFNNEHKRFLAAKDKMKKIQQHKTTKLLQDWQAARDHVNVMRKSNPKQAELMGADTAKRFQNLYASYEQEDASEKQQLLAVHQQHVQVALNERKRETMDKYMKALEKEDVEKISQYLHAYIKSEEKDRMHTVNHYEHIKSSNPHEALRFHPFIVNHLKLSEQRIDQALEMLTRNPDIEVKVRPQIEEFMHRFDAIATSIRNVVLPVPTLDIDEERTAQAVDLNSMASKDDDIRIAGNDFDLSSEEVNADGDGTHEDEHSYERTNFQANRQQDGLHVQQGVVHSSVQSSHLGSTLGIALGGVSVFVIIVVAVIMVRRNNSRSSSDRGYVEVDLSASPEDRHLANMQMNGYENPTYRYFEVQNNPKA